MAPIAPEITSITALTPSFIAGISFFMAAQNNHGVIAVRILGPKQINNANGLPAPVPGTATSGENANERALGVSVLEIKLTSPKSDPK